MRNAADHVFQQPTVCGILLSAVKKPSNVTFVAEADPRYNAVGIPLMGGRIAEELIEQAPANVKQECKDLLEAAR